MIGAPVQAESLVFGLGDGGAACDASLLSPFQFFLVARNPTTMWRTALPKAISIPMPKSVTVRGNTLQLLLRALRSVLEALQDSRERAARRIVEDYRRQSGE